MLLAQGRYWRVTLTRKRAGALFALGKLSGELEELAAFEVEVPLVRWNSLVKLAESDRKLLGGLLLDHAEAKDLVAKVVGSDRLLSEMQRMVRDATIVLIEAGALAIAPASEEE
jgi:hypothetical protein